MASKTVFVGNKRKSESSTKPDLDKKLKKLKFDKKPPQKKDSPEAVGDESDFDDESSDSEDGGVVLAKNTNSAKPKNTSSSKVFEKGANSRESHIKQKQLALERKSSKPLADELHRSKKLWEKLRRKSHVPKEERDKLVEDLFEIVTGRVKDFALKHDAVRVVQTAIKYSTPERRKMIARELQGTYVQLAESRYAKFLIGKLLVAGDNESRDIVISEFYGKVRKLINHPEASWILDDVYRGVATPKQKAQLLREWYGPEFALFQAHQGEETADLSKIIQSEPSKRAPIMKSLGDMINQLVQKKMTGFTMLHDAMLQYYLNVNAESEEGKEFLELVKGDENGDLLKNMAFTKSGARLVCLLLAYGSAKDRKHILKTYKDTFQLMSSDPHGHMIILTAFDVIDDTVLTTKSIIPELLGKDGQQEVENVVVCANDPNARIVIRYPFEGASSFLFDAGHAGDLDILREIWEIRKVTSKKDPEVRRKELVASLSPILLRAIAQAPSDLASTAVGCQLIQGVILSGVGDKTEALRGLASCVSGDPNTDADTTVEDVTTSSIHISKTTHGGRLFKTLISGGFFDKATKKIRPVDPPLQFADILYPIIEEHIITWATGPSSFVVVSLLEADDFSRKEELKGRLKKSKKELQRAASEETLEQKAAAEESNAVRPTKKATKAAAARERSIGNKGSQILLEKL